MKKMYIMIGVSGSGKTEYISEHKNVDDIVISVDKMKKEQYGTIDAEIANDFQFWDDFHERIDEAMNTDQDIWIDATNLYSKDRIQLKKIASKNEYQSIAIYIDRPLNELFIFSKVNKNKVLEQFYSLERPIEGVDVDEVKKVI